MQFSILNFQFSNKRGFTLIELLIVFSVIGIISSAGIVAFFQYSRSQVLQSATTDLIATLNSARSRAQAQIVASTCPGGGLVKGYQVRFAANPTPTPFRVNYYLEAACKDGSIAVPTLDTKTLPSEIGWDFGNGFPTFLFNVVTGSVTTTPADITQIKLTGFNNAASYIGVSTVGAVRILPTPTPTP